MNKKNLWFLTLFSLVLVLSIYYVTIPNEIFKDISKDNSTPLLDSTENVSVVASLKLEDDSKVLKEMNSLKEKLINNSLSVNEKNSLFEELKMINKNSSKEETLEAKIKDIFNYDNFIKIDGNNVRVVLEGDNPSLAVANNIMRSIQEEFDSKKFISVKFN